MEGNDNVYVYDQENVCNEDEMYIITDEANRNLENFQDFVLADGNVLQLQDNDHELGDLGDGQYVYYDESGQAYMIDPSNNETDNSNFLNGHSSLNNMNVDYNCPLCTQVYQNANAFTKHMREKHFVKVFTCRQCEKFFDNLSLLFLHARRTHVDPKKPSRNPSSFKFHCPDCVYMTNNGGTMEHHLRAHSGIKPYICDICDKSFAQKANMKTHRNRHIHKDRLFRCETCTKSFNSHDIYLAHLRTREHELQEHFQLILTTKIQIRCLGCNEELSSYYDVNIHSRTCDILKDLQNKFYCIQCKVEFSSSMLLKHHLKGHGGNQIISCPVCGERGFPGFNQLNHHITRAHALKVNRRNVCRYCEMTFETKDLHFSHIEEMHSSEKNARQSRGAAGRLRCRFEPCDFTSNSVMQMDRHHVQHDTNCLPSTSKRAIKRRKKIVKKEEKLVDCEIERVHSTITEDEVLRIPYGDDDIKLELVDSEEIIVPEDDDLDDLMRLAATYVEKPIVNKCYDDKPKRRPPNKPLKKSFHYRQPAEHSIISNDRIQLGGNCNQAANHIARFSDVEHS